MVSANKLRKATSILTFNWMLIFICLSTSHMGNEHNLFIPDDTITHHSFTKTTQKNNDCPWTFAALMTLADLMDIDYYTSTEIYKLSIVELQQYNTSNIYFNIQPRGPPVS